MTNTSYGVNERGRALDDLDRHVEQIALKGFTVLSPVFQGDELEAWRDKIDNVYAIQEKEFGREALSSIGELDTCRAPLLYDFSFISLAQDPKVLKIVRRILGDWIILHLQNAVINRPDAAHHQTAWHRDLPYQNFVISKPLAISALVVIDVFSEETGGTMLLPFSHKNEIFPSESYVSANAISIEAPAGSVILFDAMLFHRAGSNMSKMVRRAVNHVYTVPILKQQYDFPRALASHADITPELATLLGLTSQVPLDDRSWRSARARRLLGG